MDLEILTYSFMHRALASGAAIGALCSVIGLFLVLRRYSLFGDAMAHASFGGVAVGLWAGLYPLWTAYAVSIVSALVITKVKDRYNISGDASIAVLLSAGIAIGLVIIGLSGGFTLDIFSFLFGSILLVGTADTALIITLAAAILAIVALLYRQLLYSTFNEEQARVSGIRVERINYLLVMLAGVTVVTSIQLVGVLLISALFVIPNVTAIMYGRGFKQTATISVALSTFSVVSGILASYVLDITPAGTIVMISIILLGITMALKSLGVLPRG